MVETYNTIITRNARVYSVAPKGSFIMPAFFAFTGLVLIVSVLTEGRGVANEGFIMGLGFLGFGLVLFLYTRFYNRKVFNARTDT